MSDKEADPKIERLHELRDQMRGLDSQKIDLENKKRRLFPDRRFEGRGMRNAVMMRLCDDGNPEIVLTCRTDPVTESVIRMDEKQAYEIAQAILAMFKPRGA